MKQIVMLAFLFLLFGLNESSFAQEPTDGEVYQIVDDMPKFPGGEDALFKFLGENIQYPEKAKELGVQGVVYVSFVIEESGELGNVKVIRGIGAGCDEEAIRVIKSMPNWKPGTINGKEVRVQYNLPIRYTLTGVGPKKRQ